MNVLNLNFRPFKAGFLRLNKERNFPRQRSKFVCAIADKSAQQKRRVCVTEKHFSEVLNKFPVRFKKIPNSACGVTFASTKIHHWWLLKDRHVFSATKLSISIPKQRIVSIYIGTDIKQDLLFRKNKSQYQNKSTGVTNQIIATESFDCGRNCSVARARQRNLCGYRRTCCFCKY